MQIKRFFTPGLSINSYLIFDEETRRGALIDPTRHIEVYLAQALLDKVAITDILETHVHADFVSGAKELKAALGGKPVIHCSGMGGEEWIPHYADHIVKDRDSISLGNVHLEALHTPGHTPEHLIWLAFDERRSPRTPCVAFTGDLLFVGSVGRPDLMGHELEEILVKQLYRSLFNVLYALPEFLQVYPGHGAESLCGKGIGGADTSTLGYEKHCNPWLLPQSYGQWHANLLKDIPAAPAYFRQMKRVNVTGLAKPPGQELPPILTMEQLRAYLPDAVLVDARGPEAFAAGHLKETLNIPFAPHFSTWAGSVLPQDKEIILMVEHAPDALPVLQALRLIGMDRVRGICLASQWPWEAQEVATSPMIDVERLQKEQPDFFILDVRAPHEWHDGHIAGAHHVELSRIPQSLELLPKDVPIAVVCRSGTRASVIASLLNRQAGYASINVRGGMQAWLKAGYPVVVK